MLKGSGLVSSSDVVDQLFCEQLFQATSASRNGQFALTEQLQTRPDGNADLLCVVTPNDGTSKGSASAG